METLSFPLVAERLGFAPGPFGRRSWCLESADVGF